MTAAPDYTQEMMGDQIRAWFDAVAAHRAGEHERAIALLVPEADDATTYGMLIANISVGALLVGMQLADANGQQPWEGPADGRWVVEAIDPRREGTAVERFVAIAVTTAANGDHERVIQQVQAFAHPSVRGLKRLATAMSHLLALLAAVRTEEDQR